eukprot:scaffold170445_cov18-Tisochrysis_lutea.AAC.1
MHQRLHYGAARTSTASRYFLLHKAKHLSCTSTTFRLQLADMQKKSKNPFKESREMKATHVVLLQVLLRQVLQVPAQ